MTVTELKSRLQQYHAQKGYGRWYLWGDSEIITLLTYFLAAKNSAATVSCKDFHHYLIQLDKADLLQPFTRDTPIDNLRHQCIFKPWLAELNVTERNTIKNDAEKCLDRKYPSYHGGSSGSRTWVPR
jgi:hypothetical protein